MATMKAVRIHEFGGPQVLKTDEVPIPQPKDDDLVVRVHAASANPVDYKIRSGAVFGKDALPIALGRDVSGTIEICGTRANLKKGDAVYAHLGWDRGGYAEYVLVHSGEYAAKPSNIDHVRAAAVPLAAMTAWQGLFDHGGLQSGQRVLIHGGAGGVGHLAIQFAKAKGAWVATTVSHLDFDFVRELGADQAIDYKQERFEEEVHDIDLVFDLVAGETQDRSWNVLKHGGALVSTLQKPSGEKARAHDARVATNYMAQPNAAQLAEVAKLIEAGQVKPHVDRAFPLEKASEAQSYLEHQHVRGKVVLHVTD
jgi:NADPH:quinone reductase-like Zn-dependent oxidoreductase